MSLIKLHLPPDGIKKSRRNPEGSYFCKAIGEPVKGQPFTRLVVFKEGMRFETNTSIEFVSLKYGERGADLSNIQIVAPDGVIPSKSEVGDDGIVCIMQENTPRCEECDLNLVKRFDIKKQEPYMVCPANRWGLNLCKNADRHDMDCRRESEEERKQRLKDQTSYSPNWGEKYGLEFKSYEDYLKSDLWKQKRSTVLSVLGGRCQICKDKTGITVHHVSYERIGKELIDDLQVLCKDCHKMVHFLVSERPKQYTIQNCVAEIFKMNAEEAFSIRRHVIESMPERRGLSNIDFDEMDRETAEIVTFSWKRFPATQPQNNLLGKLGYDGPPLNKQEAFFKIKELNGFQFKPLEESNPQEKTQSNSIEIEDPCFVQERSEMSWLNSHASQGRKECLGCKQILALSDFASYQQGRSECRHDKCKKCMKNDRLARKLEKNLDKPNS